MRSPWISIVYLLIASFAFGHLPPLTSKDVGLMLRAGYTSETVQHELSSRHLMGALTPSDESALLRSGASAALIDAMKAGAFALPANEVAAAQSKLAADAAHRAAEGERSRANDTLYQAQLASRHTASPSVASTTHPIAAALKGDLVVSKNGTSSRFNEEPLAQKKLIGLYFSAHWCPPCRKFTPELVQFYNRVAPQHSEFEIVFVSLDRTQ